MSKKRILILSAYDAMSHEYWRTGLVKNMPEYDWTTLSLPPRYFAWRVRGNSLSWAMLEREKLREGYDLIIATSMTDFASLRGMVPEISDIPAIVYFHENQFAYPENRGGHGHLDAAMVNLYSAVCVDRVVFNTDFNRQTFLAGAGKFLKKMPDFVPKNVVADIEKKSSILFVPIKDVTCFEKEKSSVPTILWNHRWEYDKAPETFYEALKILSGSGFEFKLNIVGQTFRDVPVVFEKIKDEFASQIESFGFVAGRSEYVDVLKGSDIVVSCALHDFQGLAVMEAVDYGCVPVLPKRLAYTEIFDREFLYEDGKNSKEDADNMAEKIMLVWKQEIKAPDMRKFSWENLVEDYRSLIESTLR